MLGSFACPNPFTDAVSVRFRIPAALAGEGSSPVRMKIVDPTGRVVSDISTTSMTRGEQALHWDGLDEAGRELPSGIYIYAIEIGSESEVGRLLKLK
jgi:flagellar hook assembly protein FlgD